MSGYTGQENTYWTQSPPLPQGQFNFESSGFGQPNQQFEFQTYSEQATGDYSYGRKSFLDPTQSSYGNDPFNQDDYARGRYIRTDSLFGLSDPRANVNTVGLMTRRARERERLRYKIFRTCNENRVSLEYYSKEIL